MLNRIILVGRLTKDPELRKSNSDVSIAVFDIAVDNTLKENDGTRGTCFLTCQAFGDKADNIAKFTRKGDKVALDGSLNQRNFIRQDGSKGHVVEVIVDSVEFLQPKPVNAEDGKEQVLRALPPEAKFDPITGKPLKPKAKK